MFIETRAADIHVAVIQLMFADIIRYTNYIAKNIEEYKLQYNYYKSAFISLCKQLNNLYISLSDDGIEVDKHNDMYDIQIIGIVAKSATKYLAEPSDRYDEERLNNVVDKIIGLISTADSLINYTLEMNKKYRKAELMNLVSKLIYKYSVYSIRVLNLLENGDLTKGCFVVELSDDNEDKMCENMYHHYIKKYDELAKSDT